MKANPGVRLGQIPGWRLALFDGLIFTARLSLLVCLGSFSAYDALVRKHARAIQSASQLSTTPKVLFSRSNPALYQSLIQRGWLPWGWEGCRPPLPQVEYDPDFGYPSQVKLYGNPCAATNEEARAASIQIEISQIIR